LSPPARVPDFVLWKSFSHDRSSRALSPQKFSGSSMDFLYSCLYSSRFSRWGLPCLLELWSACALRNFFSSACDHLLEEGFGDLVSRHSVGLGDGAFWRCLLFGHACDCRSRACQCEKECAGTGVCFALALLRKAFVACENWCCSMDETSRNNRIGSRIGQ
jgi:hypothetical protein